MGSFPLPGVEGDCMGLARGRLDCCEGVVDAGRVVGAGDRAVERRLCWEGVVDAGRICGAGERVERLNGLRTGRLDAVE